MLQIGFFGLIMGIWSQIDIDWFTFTNRNADSCAVDSKIILYLGTDDHFLDRRDTLIGCRCEFDFRLTIRDQLNDEFLGCFFFSSLCIGQPQLIAHGVDGAIFDLIRRWVFGRWCKSYGLPVLVDPLSRAD